MLKYDLAHASDVISITTADIKSNIHYNDSITIELSMYRLKRVIKIRLILIFIGIVALAIFFTGYLFNMVIG